MKCRVKDLERLKSSEGDHSAELKHCEEDDWKAKAAAL